MNLTTATSPEIAAYLEQRKLLLLPVGATEQHGSHGLLGTDAILAEAVAKAAGQRLGIAVAPVISYGMSQFHLSFAGSFTLRPTTLIALVGDILRSACAQGFKRIYILNGHGGNTAPVRAALQEIHAGNALHGRDDPALRFRLRSWWQGPSVSRLVQDLYGPAEGYHATASEIAMVLHLYPGLALPFPAATQSNHPDELARDHLADDYDGPADFRRRYPGGTVLSDPSRSKAQDGEKLLAAAVQDLAADLEDFIAEP